MASFSPRSGKSNYIKRRGNHHYYRRAIPPKFRAVFGGKTEWNIRLEGKTDAQRKAEAGALAHDHNRQMTLSDVADATYIKESSDLSVRLDLSEGMVPPGMVPGPFKFWRDGKMIETYKIAISDDPSYLRKAENDGYFAMSRKEGEAQVLLGEQRTAEPPATEEGKELAELRSDKAIREIEDAAPVRGDTISSILPVMHEKQKPREPTRAKHLKAASEFSNLHGDLPLVTIARKHVAEYVDHLGTLTINDKPMAPTTIKQRLDTITAILQFATKSEIIPFNPAKSVDAPKDVRPLADQTYKPFSKSEIRKLVSVSTDMWANRIYQSHETKLTRKTDFITALQILIWTGARPEEVCQLRVDDIDVTRQALIITNESDGLPFKPRETKNEDSVRGVPIHAKLLPVVKDHLKYVGKVSNSGLLFPSLATIEGRYARPISTEWTQNLRTHITNDPQKVLYSLRHSWAAESKRIGMPEWLRNSIMGHASESPSGSSKRYGHHFDQMDVKLEWTNKMDCLNG